MHPGIEAIDRRYCALRPSARLDFSRLQSSVHLLRVMCVPASQSFMQRWKSSLPTSWADRFTPPPPVAGVCRGAAGAGDAVAGGGVPTARSPAFWRAGRRVASGGTFAASPGAAWGAGEAPGWLCPGAVVPDGVATAGDPLPAGAPEPEPAPPV